MDKKYEYVAEMASLYDYNPFLSKNVIGDKELESFYLSNTKEFEYILEHGAATGIFTILMAKNNRYIDSVEISHDMINIIKDKLNKLPQQMKKNICLYEMDSLKFNSGRLYDEIILPDSIILALADKKKQLKILENSYNMLKKNGKVLMDFFPPNNELIRAKEMKQSYARAKDKNGSIFIIERQELWDSETQITELKFIHKEWKNELKEIVSFIKYRYLYENEVINMLNEVGFKKIEYIPNLSKNNNVGIIAIK